ncbi:MAG: hypothetical protein AB7O26_18350, partial [Planctomycetaceae bacterium]
MESTASDFKDVPVSAVRQLSMINGDKFVRRHPCINVPEFTAAKEIEVTIVARALFLSLMTCCISPVSAADVVSGNRVVPSSLLADGVTSDRGNFDVFSRNTLLAFESGTKLSADRNVACEGTYQHHLQGVCADEKSIFWSFTTTLVKTDWHGKVLAKTPVANHHGDLCLHDGKLYVAVNLGKFNDPKGNADSWVYVYDARNLNELVRHETQEVFHGAGGIGHREGHFFVVGGLPDGVPVNYVYEYDGKFRFLKKHIIKSGHTHLGI